MRSRDKRRHQIGRFWLYKLPRFGMWYICWLEQPASGRAVTRRKSTGIGGGEPDHPPQAALDALAAHHLEFGIDRKLRRDEAIVENLMADWLKHHVAELDAPERYVASTLLWSDFFEIERRAGRIPDPLTVDALSPHLVRRFVVWRRDKGVGGHTISRDLAALRGALRWAWKNHKLESAPYIADIPEQLKAAPRDRVLSFNELARMLDACKGKADREHIIRFIMIELGTAGRPEAVLQLTDTNIDLPRGLIDPSQEGRRHLRKRRVIVPIARHVRPWLLDDGGKLIEGKIIKYRAPIAERNRQRGGPTHFERETASIKTSWNAVCREVGVEGATPKTLRHTMLTWLATRGVPKEQREALAGHTPRGTTARNYEHLTPDYLREAIREVDAFFVELGRHTKSHLRFTCDSLASIWGVVEGGRGV